MKKHTAMLLFVSCLLVWPALSQEFRSTVSGHVTDASGAAVPNVKVQVVFNARASYNRFIEKGYGAANANVDVASFGLPQSLLSQLPSPVYFGVWQFDSYQTLGRSRNDIAGERLARSKLLPPREQRVIGRAADNAEQERSVGIAFQMDMSLLKRTKITERVSAQFGFEAFNALNHNYYGRDNLNTNPESALFGSVIPSTVSTQNILPRQIQVRMKVSW